MHAILFVGLFFVFQWNTESTDVVYAELWSPAQMSSATPAPKEEVKTEPVKEEPQKEPEEKPEPQEKPEPEPEPKPEPAPPPPAPKVEEKVQETPDEDVIREQEEEKRSLNNKN